LSLEKARQPFTEKGFKKALSQLSLVVPDKDCLIAFARLTAYIEDQILRQIASEEWAAARDMLDMLTDIPDARSLPGRMWEALAHREVVHLPTLHLKSLDRGVPDKTIIGNVGPLHLVKLIDEVPDKADAGPEDIRRVCELTIIDRLLGTKLPSTQSRSSTKRTHTGHFNTSSSFNTQKVLGL
jgi:hypothetical protein